MAFIPQSGSVVAFQSDPTKLQVTASVAGVVGASIIGIPTIQIGGSVIGVPQGSVATVIIGGSIAASFTPPANQSVSGTVQVQVQASIAAVIIGGSILTTSTPNQSVSGTVGASIIGVVPITQSGMLITSIVGAMAGTGTLSSVISSISTVSILSANINRKGATIYNNAGTTVYLNLGTPAQTSVYAVALIPNAYYELPYGYTGVVAGITASNAGLISVNELT